MNGQSMQLALRNYPKWPCPALNLPITPFTIKGIIKPLYQDINTNILHLPIILICLCLPTYSYLYSNISIRPNYFYVFKYDRHTMSYQHVHDQWTKWTFILKYTSLSIPGQYNTSSIFNTQIRINCHCEGFLNSQHSKVGSSLSFYSILVIPALI